MKFLNHAPPLDGVVIARSAAIFRHKKRAGVQVKNTAVHVEYRCHGLYSKGMIEHSGGLPGIKDEGQLPGVLEHIQNDRHYPDLVEKLSHLVFAVNKFHVFSDGNKRSGLALALILLRLTTMAIA